MPWLWILGGLIVVSAVLRRKIVNALPGFAELQAYPSVPGALMKREVVIGTPERGEMVRAVEAVQRISMRMGLGPAIVTSGMDGMHIKGSLHYLDLARDFRTRDLEGRMAQALVKAVQLDLGRAYDVIDEGPELTRGRYAAIAHMHVEWDPKTKELV